MSQGHQGHEHPHTSLGESTSVIELEPGLGGGAGLLTPADVHSKVFSTVRLREGYDLAQVDTFLDLVERTLSSVLRENAALAARLTLSAPGSAPAGKNATHIVALAHHTGAEAIAMAQEQARDIVAEARSQAQDLKREALDYGQRMREGLEAQIHQLRTLLAELDEQGGHAADFPVLSDHNT
ncbi:MAG TPA: DivIVA domain-containing protein [Actinomadura sp.]|jgi:DivIVA domain-containing protein|nr:DivIVA domain-containing protein [Actinomadura sp.]